MTSRIEHLAEGVSLYLGDCREILPTLGKVDAVVTDPPYGTRGKDAESRHDAANGWRQYGVLDWDKEPPAPAVFDLMRSVSGAQIIWGGNYFTDALPPSSKWLIWDKGQSNFSLADVELAWCSFDGAARRIIYSRALAMQDGKEHPTQKPIAVMQWCIERIPPPATIILDPFCGSGTTGVAAVKLGRQFIGIERVESYFDIACRRISEALKQPDNVHRAPSTGEARGV